MNSETQIVRPIRDPAEKHSVQLKRDLQLMKDYLMMCTRKEDWHGVMDASADIREIVAKLSILTPPARHEHAFKDEA
ncbi:hypothetical protein [Stenotrophobium rhamnosiphilum]|uniref:Uncharacterized protein n=1 Tax=Stenotrophobium rhamnosiphilum TaxID=2029166 RepID=A0A2T5MEB4_9GAMM|nr:hypothetical protein [Stenotrophobium rhamnosiphilum]PTU30918.1 hypothetical protein CJD38_11440 [Stenotrophobium rhamnosiphilum]